MSKIFYDHLVEIEQIKITLLKNGVVAEHLDEMILIIDEHIHHRVLDLILQHLPTDKHESFLKDMYSRPHDPKLIDYLKKAAHPEIESHIKNVVLSIVDEVLREIKRSKKVR